MTRWRPTSGPDVAVRRAALLSRLRSYFEREQVLAVDTPALSGMASSESQIESLAVTSILSHQPLFLHTSSESCMKRLLAAGYPDIYSICRVYRDGECGAHHQPEFTMLEWYRLRFNLRQIIDDTLNVIATALDDSQLLDSVAVFEYRDAFIELANVDPMTATVSELAYAAGADDALQKSLGDNRDDWLDLLLATKVCREFRAGRLTVLRHYPVTQAALSRRCPNDPLLADRFEVFMGPVELANGYVELTDAEEQAARIEMEQIERQRRGQALRPGDQKLVAALVSGLPECCGVAIGVERLQMVYEKTDDIRNVISFAFENANKKSSNE